MSAETVNKLRDYERLKDLAPTESQPIPREIQKLLREAYSVSQLAKMALSSRELMTIGFGRLVVTFARRHPQFLETVKSEELKE